MCGRYTLTSPHDIAEHFDVDPMPDIGARYNIAPSQESVIVTIEDGTRSARAADWGFGLPPREGAGGKLVINARSEDIEARPLFRDAFAESRCLVPASGFFEWRKIGRMRQPFYFSVPESSIFAFAGLYSEAPDGRFAYVVLTTAANSVVAEVHHRMPVILERAAYETWMSPRRRDRESLAALLEPWPAEKTASWPVGMRVNDAAYEDPSCLSPLEGPVDLFMY